VAPTGIGSAAAASAAAPTTAAVLEGAGSDCVFPGSLTGVGVIPSATDVRGSASTAIPAGGVIRAPFGAVGTAPVSRLKPGRPTGVGDDVGAG